MNCFKSQVFTLKRILFGCLLLALAAGGVFSAVGNIASGNENYISFLPIMRLSKDHIYGMVRIEDGVFQMGCVPSPEGYPCGGDALPVHVVSLSTYYIDLKEVTNAQYAQCVGAGICTPPASNASHERTAYYDDPLYADYPVIYVNWEQAEEYCTWKGRRLPTEAEWELAAGGTGFNVFPWGIASPTCARANFYDVENTGSYCIGDTSWGETYEYGASPYGALDMAGNVWEWVSDWYDEDYYSSSTLVNPTGPETGTYKVMRGGAWSSEMPALLKYTRQPALPTDQTDAVGFRCVQLP